MISLCKLKKTAIKRDTNRNQSSSFKTVKRNIGIKSKFGIVWEIKIKYRNHRTELILVYHENSISF